MAKDVIDSTKDFLDSCNLLKELKSSFIVLVLKMSGASSFGEFCPISLCNSICNIFYKVFVVRLQKVLP